MPVATSTAIAAGTALAGGAASAYSASKKADAAEARAEAGKGPWGPQQTYLTDIFSGAEEQAKEGPYEGDRYANLNDTQKGALNDIQNYANGQGQQYAQQVSNTSQGLLNQGTEAMTEAANTGTQDVIDSGQQYAESGYLEGQIDAVNRDISRQLQEDVLPSINNAAVSSGNLNSSRAGAASAIAARGAKDRMADTAAEMRSAAYNSGLDRTMNHTGQQLQAGNSMAQAGMQGLAQGQSMAYKNANNELQAGSVLQADEQSQLAADQEAYNAEWENLSKYKSLVSGQYGSKRSSAAVGPSPVASGIQGALGGATSAIGAMGQAGMFDSSSSYTPSAQGALQDAYAGAGALSAQGAGQSSVPYY